MCSAMQCFVCCTTDVLELLEMCNSQASTDHVVSKYDRSRLDKGSNYCQSGCSAPTCSCGMPSKISLLVFPLVHSYLACTNIEGTSHSVVWNNNADATSCRVVILILLSVYHCSKTTTALYCRHALHHSRHVRTGLSSGLSC